MSPLQVLGVTFKDAMAANSPPSVLLCFTADKCLYIVFFVHTDEMPNGQPEGESSDLTCTLPLLKKQAIMNELEHKQ